MSDCSVELSLIPENQKFLSCDSTWAAAYFLTDYGFVIRCSFVSNSVITVHVLCLETGKWEKNNSLVTERSQALLPTSDLFPHLGSFVIPVDSVDSQTDTKFLLACTDQTVYMVKQEEERSCLYLIDSPKFCSVIHLTMHLTEGTKIVRALAGNAFVMLLDSAGRVHSFGCGTRGELGHGSLESRTEPSLLHYFDSTRIIDIAVGGWHTLALTGPSQSKVVDTPVAVPIPEEYRAVAIACGSRHSLVLAERNNLYAFGCNDYGQLDFSSCTVKKEKNEHDCIRLMVSDSVKRGKKEPFSSESLAKARCP
ncbi:RCC1 2 and RCC1 domain containing protein [Trichuris trichiura]|uniref:RCC1 2 and RCC1 domain containing protein n=1 Tax=Trichuris trichiura TaxID=36087 RepID=A0A077ZH92_TRITR|nr:RCC1 2 and RCC1 domain containing protein [Trichuris trichiura]